VGNISFWVFNKLTLPYENYFAGAVSKDFLSVDLPNCINQSFKKQVLIWQNPFLFYNSTHCLESKNRCESFDTASGGVLRVKRIFFEPKARKKIRFTLKLPFCPSCEAAKGSNFHFS